MFWEWGGSASQVHTVAWLLKDKVSIVISRTSSLLSWMVCWCCQIAQNKAADDSFDFFTCLYQCSCSCGNSQETWKNAMHDMNTSLAIAGLATISCNSDSAYDANKLDYVLHSQWWHLFPRVCWPQCPARIWVWPWGSGEPHNALSMSFFYFSTVVDFFVTLDKYDWLVTIHLPLQHILRAGATVSCETFFRSLLEMQSIITVMVDGWIKFTSPVRHICILMPSEVCWEISKQWYRLYHTVLRTFWPLSRRFSSPEMLWLHLRLIWDCI